MTTSTKSFPNLSFLCGRVGRELSYVIHYLFHRWDIHLHKFRGDIITEILNEEDFIMEETLNDSDLKALELYRLSSTNKLIIYLQIKLGIRKMYLVQ